MYDERTARSLVVIGLALSLMVHLAIWRGLAILPSLDEALAVLHMQEVELIEEPPPPPEPEPEPEEAPPEPEPEPEIPPPPMPRERPQTPEPEEVPPEEPPAAEEQIEDFTGETLTNDSGETWASAVGNGAATGTPIGAPTGVVTGRHRSGVEGGEIGASGGGEPGTHLVAIRDLSHPPDAPPRARLAELIQRFYPSELRNLTIEGTARVHLRIGADGSVSRVRVRSESHEGFGAACVHVLQEAGAWGHPIDRQGNPATTEVNFDCGFSLRI